MPVSANQGIRTPDPTDPNDPPGDFLELLAGVEPRLVQRFVDSADLANRRPEPEDGELAVLGSEVYVRDNGAWLRLARVSDLAATSATPTLSNGWTNYGGSFGGWTAYKQPSGMVVVQGMLKAGTTAAATTVGAMPGGFRPLVTSDFVVSANTASGITATVRIENTGAIILMHSASAVTLLGSGFAFQATP